jgi:hypothetical protein
MKRRCRIVFLYLGSARSSYSPKHFHEWTAEPQISPLRCAPVEMTKERIVMNRSEHERRAGFGLYPRNNRRVPHIPDILCSFVGSLNFMRLSLREAHTLSCPELRAGNSGHLARFSRDVGYHRPFPQTSCGLHNCARVPHVRTSVARISYYAALTTTTHAAFSQRKPHELAQRHQPRQEIWDTSAKNDGRSLSTAFRSGPQPLFVH